MKDDSEKEKGRRDVFKAIGIAIGTIIFIVSLVLIIQQLGIR